MDTINQGAIHVICNKDLFDYIAIFLAPITAIMTFILGYIISNAINKNQENRKLTRVFDYFQLYYKNQINAIKGQIELIKEQKDKVNQLKDTSGLSITITSQPYFILDSINKEELFSSWTNNKKKDSQSLMDIIKFIEFTRKSFEKYVEYHKGFILRQSDIQSKWNNKITAWHNLKGALTSAHPEILAQNPDITKLIEIYNSMGEFENSELLSDTIQHLVNPLLEYFEPIYSKNPNNQMALALITTAQGIYIEYKMWENEIKSYNAYLTALLTSLETEIKKINE
jgi:hypothetical protein